MHWETYLYQLLFGTSGVREKKRIFQYQEATKIEVFKKVQDDIHVLMMKCNWQVSDDPVEFQVLSNWVL